MKNKDISTDNNNISHLRSFAWRFIKLRVSQREIHSLQSVLDQLYYEMLPLSSKLIAVGRGSPALQRCGFISSRGWSTWPTQSQSIFIPCYAHCAWASWRHDVPYVLAVINGILQPTFTGTAAMVTG